MAIIYSYPYVSTVNNSDTLVISVSDTTADNGFLTKSLTADDLASYVTARVNLNFLGDTGTGIVNLDTQNLTISGTANEIETAASTQTLQIGLPDNVTITNNLTVGNNTSVQGTLNVTGQSTLSSVNVTDLTSGRVVLVGANGELQDDIDLTFAGSTLTATNLSVNGLTQTSTLLVSSTSTFEGELSMSSNKIVNLLDPTLPQDAVTKSYADALVTDQDLDFQGDSGTGSVDLDSEVFDIAGGTYLVTSASNQTLTADLSAVDGVAVAGERYLTKNNTWAEVSLIPGTYSFSLAGDTGIPEVINSGDTLSVLGGAYISTVVGATDTLTIDHDATTRTDTTSTTSPGSGGSFAVVDSVSTNATGHLEAINLKTVTLPSSVDGSGTLNYVTKWTPDGDTLGDSQIFDNGTDVGVGLNTPATKLHVDGSGIFGQSHDNTTIGTNSFKTGEQNIASGAHAVAINDQNTASGQSSFSFGNQNIVSGLNSAAGGQLNVITSEESFAFGLMCKDNQTGITGTRQILLGTSLTPPRSSSNTAASTQIVVGKFNNDVDQPPTAFVVGTGTSSSAKQNSLAVSYSGQVRLEKVATFSYNNDAGATAGGIKTGGLYQKDGVVLINRGGGSTINPVSPQTTGTWTPQILADTASELVISSYDTQEGRWVRTKNLVQCDFTIRILTSNMSGYVGGTSALSIQGWPYDHDGSGDFSGRAFSRIDGFDVESKGNFITENAGIGNVKLNILKQDSSVTTYFATTNMQPDDLGSSTEIFINGSFSYTTSTNVLNSGATIDT